MPAEVIRTGTEELFCDLTEAEWTERATRMAHVEEELERHTGHEQQIKTDLKANRTRLEAERASLAGQVRSRSELRSVEIQHIANYRSGVFQEVRVDTGAVVRQRSLTPEERQGQLPLEA